MTLSVRVLVIVSGLLAVARGAAAQPVFTDAFPPEEFAAHRARVIAAIGDGVAIVHGAPERSAEIAFRQNNHAFYLSGVELPRLVIVLDGRTKRVDAVSAGAERAARAHVRTGARPGRRGRERHGVRRGRRSRPASPPRSWRSAATAGPIYTPFRPEVARRRFGRRGVGHAAATAADPWDGRGSREAAFIAKLRSPGAAARAPQPRSAPRRRALHQEPARDCRRSARRRASPASASWKRCARRAPGTRELELSAAAEYVFRKFGSQGPAYFPLSASGPTRSTRTITPGRGAGRRRPGAVRLRARLSLLRVRRDPRLPGQRHVHAVAARALHDLPAALSRGDDARFGRACRCATCCVRRWRRWTRSLAAFTFSEPKIEEAARRFVEPLSQPARAPRRASATTSAWRSTTSTVAGRDAGAGRLFTIEPAISIPEDHWRSGSRT